MDICKYEEKIDCPCKRESDQLILCNHAEYIVNYSLIHDYRTITENKYFGLICDEFQKKISKIDYHLAEIYYPIRKAVQDMENGRIKQGDEVFKIAGLDNGTLLTFPEAHCFDKFWEHSVLFGGRVKIKNNWNEFLTESIPSILFISKAENKAIFEVKLSEEDHDDLFGLLQIARRLGFRVEK